jgi:hypothetical protein
MPLFADIDWLAVACERLSPPFIPNIESDADTSYFEDYPDLTKESEGATFDNEAFADF